MGDILPFTKLKVITGYEDDFEKIEYHLDAIQDILDEYIYIDEDSFDIYYLNSKSKEFYYLLRDYFIEDSVED